MFVMADKGESSQQRLNNVQHSSFLLSFVFFTSANLNILKKCPQCRWDKEVGEIVESLRGPHSILLLMCRRELYFILLKSLKNC